VRRPAGGRRRVLDATGLLIAVALAACSLGEDSPALEGEVPPSETTISEPSTTTTRPTTTTSPACPEVERATSDEGEVERALDADGDGEEDVAQMFADDDGTRSLVVGLSAGGGAVEVLPDVGEEVALLGGADVDGDGSDELWLRVGSGAATVVLALYQLEGCRLEAVVFPNGDRVELPIGGSVANVVGAECASGRESVVDREADLLVYEGRLVPGAADEYEVTTTEHRLDRAVLTPSPDGSRTETSQPDLAVVAGFRCGDLDL